MSEITSVTINYKNTSKSSFLPFGIKKSRGDLSILFVVSFLAVFGLFMVYSASCYTAETLYHNKWYFLTKQAVGVVIGFIAMIAVSFFPYQKLKKYKWIKWLALIISLVFLSLVFIPALGKTSYGATRWIRIGGVTIQPSEIAKYGYVLFASLYISENAHKVKKFTGIIPLILSGGALCVLIMLEPNMSITMCVAMLVLGYLFLSGTKIKNLLLIGIPVIILVPVLIFSEPYRIDRLLAFLNPWSSPKAEGYQLIQSLYALGNGGWFGVGYLNSTQKLRFLPFAESDFILSVIGEEFGFIGVIVFFAVCGFLIYKGFKIASHSDTLFGYLVASGISMVYGIQVMINALVVTGSIPPTGLVLPLISSGNTSIIMTMLSFGILYNISKNQKPYKIIND